MRIIFDMTLPAKFDGHADVRIGFKNGQMIGQPRLLNAEMIIDNPFKLQESNQTDVEQKRT
jgi:hypothetical protein